MVSTWTHATVCGHTLAGHLVGHVKLAVGPDRGGDLDDTLVVEANAKGDGVALVVRGLDIHLLLGHGRGQHLVLVLPLAKLALRHTHHHTAHEMQAATHRLHERGLDLIALAHVGHEDVAEVLGLALEHQRQQLAQRRLGDDLGKLNLAREERHEFAGCLGVGECDREACDGELGLLALRYIVALLLELLRAGERDADGVKHRALATVWYMGEASDRRDPYLTSTALSMDLFCGTVR